MKVVLSVLLEAFEFSPSDKDVKWNMSNVSYPSVAPSDTKPAMPLRVKAIKRD
ncbi:hypothetical protein PHLCEN_2v5554 [Hermanssonia centrifuga]|uniref:Uncharacterized protein n=1 Tax=Hermanssonia centrifuga TaxID=98765 RepID=A0A2R6P220_9APHY|nr:hypothetical protein PHLCEN_2v5554 [Hermanssonia centrifuga]